MNDELTTVKPVPGTVPETTAEPAADSSESATQPDDVASTEDSGYWSYQVDPYTLFHFDYIEELPEVVTYEDIYALQVREYNLTLTFVWLYLIVLCVNKVFGSFKEFYKKG